MSFSAPRMFRIVFAMLGLVAASGAGATTFQSFDVYARQNSIAFSSLDASPLNTGLTFNLGDALKITASGTWNGGACGDAGPDGVSCFGDWLPGINYYSLAGRIGASGTPFKVGSSFDGLANASGTLFLFYVDSDSFNNTGFVTARVQVPGGAALVPEPGTWALLASGLGLLAWRARRRTAA